MLIFKNKINMKCKILSLTYFIPCSYYRFKWSSFSDCQNKENSEEDCFVVLKIDGSIELHTISNAFEGFSSTCNAVVTKELLKGLLNDRGKG